LKLAMDTLAECGVLAASRSSSAARLRLPGVGEDRTDALEMIVHAHERAIELLAGSEAERLLYPDDVPLNATQDEREALSFAGIICVTYSAVETFLSYARAEAMALLTAHRCALTALADELLERRTLDGNQIDRIIAGALAREDQAAEQVRRAQWAKTIENAKKFEACHA
jgi:hypothetical protein